MQIVGFEHLSRDYVNAMEMLVVEEVNRQLSQYPENLLKYIKRFEVETYALNRLPALYASSQEGLERQKKRGLKDYHGKIQAAVRQALAAVQRDPLRRSTPLVSDDDKEYQKTLLDLIKHLPKQGDLRRIVASAIRQTVRLTAQQTPTAVSPDPSTDAQPERAIASTRSASSSAANARNSNNTSNTDTSGTQNTNTSNTRNTNTSNTHNTDTSSTQNTNTSNTRNTNSQNTSTSRPMTSEPSPDSGWDGDRFYR